MADLITWAPLLLGTGLLFTFVRIGRVHPVGRVLAAALCIALSCRYLYWRLLFSIPWRQHGFGRCWLFLFLTVEFAVVLSSMLTQFFMSRHIDRRAQADATWNSPLQQSPVDVFIATYNENREILERTIVGAKTIDHSDLRVWVLDDGARPWVRELAEELNVEYVCRVNGKHAKAGNVNNGLRHALGTGRRPEFVLLLDADFVPARRILKRVLGLFEDHEVGIVQTPQHFFNPDPLQSNLVCASIWPDEQRFFFNVLLPSKDAWGAAFCCGTSAVLRVAALQAAGGMATETLTEDMLTSFKFSEYGYRTIFLNERLSLGLAPEGLKEYISQRSRWCLGAMQQIYTRWSFCGRAHITWINRLSFFDTILYWISGAPFKLMVVCAPLVYWLSGWSVMVATAGDLVYWLGPALAANLLFLALLSESRILPVMSDVTQLLTSFAVCRTVASGLMNPFGKPFKVTAKGISTTSVTVHWSLLLRFAGIAIATVSLLTIHTGPFDPLHSRPGYLMNVAWSLFNTVVLGLAAMACVEPPRRRKHERFFTDDRVSVRLDDGSELSCQLLDISLSGARLHRSEGWRPLVGPAELVLSAGQIIVPIQVARRAREEIGLNFPEDTALRRVLIEELFTGDYHNEVATVSAPKVFWSLAKALVS